MVPASVNNSISNVIVVQGEVVGILPEEEAALRRALYASLYGEKKKSPTKPDVANDSQDNLSTDPSLDQCGCSEDVLTPLKMKVEPPSPPYECSSPSGIDSSPSCAFSHLSLSSSPIGSPGSIGSSLKLVLSTSSWSSSSSSVHSIGSDPPSPFETSPTKSLPKKRTPLKQRSDKGKGKGKLIVDSSLFSGVSPVKGQKTTPTKLITPKAKSPKVTPINTPKKLKVTPKRSKGLKTSPKLSKSLSPKNLGTTKVPKVKSELSVRNPLSPEAATVFHDHCYFSSSNQPPYFLGSTDTSATKDSATTALASDVRDSSGKELLNSRTGSPSSWLAFVLIIKLILCGNVCYHEYKYDSDLLPYCSIYQAQRKFAHNHMPPHSRKYEVLVVCACVQLIMPATLNICDA